MFKKYVWRKNSIIPNNIDKFIDNLKLLVSDNIEENLTFNALGNLRGSFIFYIDIEEIIKQFPSIRVVDIIRMVAGKNIKIDSLSTTNIYKSVSDLRKGYNCWEYEIVSEEFFDRRLFRGTLTYGLNEIKNKRICLVS